MSYHDGVDGVDVQWLGSGSCKTRVLAIGEGEA